MNPNNNELDEHRRNMGQVKPEPNEPESPNGGEQVTDNRPCLIFSIKAITSISSIYKMCNFSAQDL